MRDWPLVERKRRLRRLIPSVPTRLLYVEHIRARGRDFFEVACAHDLERIVAKPVNGRYHSDGTSPNWIKITSPEYTQMTARAELFVPIAGCEHAQCSSTRAPRHLCRRRGGSRRPH
jgi:ATP-dependent DNA ligase